MSDNETAKNRDPLASFASSLYVQFSDDGAHLRRWATRSFIDAIQFDRADVAKNFAEMEAETTFWSIVDGNGLADLPSDMWAALRALVERAATAKATA